MNNIFAVSMVSLLGLLGVSAAYADGSSIDKVYDPYVVQLETEVEVRTLIQKDNEDELDDALRYKIGVGRPFNDRWQGELYWIGRANHEKGFQLEAFEGELKWQLTEQGEYDYDWGMAFELERSTRENVWEATSKLLVLHEWTRWVGTANLGLTYEWGGGIDNEWETSFGGQFKYRYKQIFEPAMEFYLGQHSQALGPVINGAYRIAPHKILAWDTGVIFGIDKETPDVSFKLNIEYEY